MSIIETTQQRRNVGFACTVIVPVQSEPSQAMRSLVALAEGTRSELYEVALIDADRSGASQTILNAVQGDIWTVGNANGSRSDQINQAVQAARSRYVCLLETGATPPTNWLEGVVAQLDASPTVGAIRSTNVGALLVRRGSFIAAGGLQETQQVGSEVLDLIFRLGSIGRTVSEEAVVGGPSALRAQFLESGYVRIENFLDGDTCDLINEQMNHYFRSENAEPADVYRVMNFHRASSAANDYLKGEKLSAVIRELIGEEPFFLQSIMFHEGSRQQLHSDWIFMSTDLLHRLVGTWMALEDVHPDAGPLRYAPGSHILPVQSIPERWHARKDELLRLLQAGKTPETKGMLRTVNQAWLYEGWQAEIERMVLEGEWEVKPFLANKGDLLIWHANLIHGGSPIDREGSTRRSIVGHFLTRAVSEYYSSESPDDGRPLSLAEVEAVENAKSEPWLVRKEGNL